MDKNSLEKSFDITETSNLYFDSFVSLLIKIQSDEETIFKNHLYSINKIQQQKENDLERLKKENSSNLYYKPFLTEEVKAWEQKGKSLRPYGWLFALSGILIFLSFLQFWYIGLCIAIFGPLYFFLKQTNIYSISEKINLVLHNDPDTGNLIENKKSISEGEILTIRSISTEFDDQVYLIKERENSILQNKLSETNKKYEELDRNQKVKNEISTNDWIEEKSDRIAELLKGKNDHESLLNILPEVSGILIKQLDNHTTLNDRLFLSSYIRVGYNLYKSQMLNEEFEIPFLVPFFNNNNLVLYWSNPDDLKTVITIAHNTLARILLSLPPNKIKLTFIDPMELGTNAASFMSLPKDIFNDMVFTQNLDIESQLSSHIRHIERVIQQYLQDKFQNLAKYNIEIDEVAEPYRIIIVYNYPEGFTESAVKKLENIIKSGPKAGTHTILICKNVSDDSNKLINRLKQQPNIYPIHIEKGRSSQFFADSRMPYDRIVSIISRDLPKTFNSKLDFKKHVSGTENLWRNESHKSFEVPIGRHGTDTLNFEYDNDVNNQALLIGKPGSGKSNLMHVIIMNSIWRYSPDNLEIYLVDFKGGVEFNIYADKNIPHFRAIAIESEREFGLSVLEGVEKELLKREILYNTKGVSNIEQFHEKFPEERMPRILFIVDEFQEFYAERDSISMKVDEKYDRIIKKGRAFGINTLFASQTLFGNSIKESTRSLIQIRIALMCAENDSKMILTEGNLAAKDLTNPGEGVYNADNGRIQGNKKFQAFYVNKEELKSKIHEVAEFSKLAKYKNIPNKQVIFRGSDLAYFDIKNHPLFFITKNEMPTKLVFWIGEPVAIDSDVTILLNKQSGSNVLIAGFEENITFKVVSGMLYSFIRQCNNSNLSFRIFDFYNQEEDNSYQNLQQLISLIPNNIEQASSKDIEVLDLLSNLKKEIEKRLQSDKKQFFPFICNIFISIQRGRIFRKAGYNISEATKLFNYILKEGPDVNVFSIVHFDTYDNLLRSFESNILREFNHMVTGKLNNENSIAILGNNKAATLGNNRCLYYDDVNNKLQKFKPYEIPKEL